MGGSSAAEPRYTFTGTYHKPTRFATFGAQYLPSMRHLPIQNSPNTSREERVRTSGQTRRLFVCILRCTQSYGKMSLLCPSEVEIERKEDPLLAQVFLESKSLSFPMARLHRLHRVCVDRKASPGLSFAGYKGKFLFSARNPKKTSFQLL